MKGLFGDAILTSLILVAINFLWKAMEGEQDWGSAIGGSVIQSLAIVAFIVVHALHRKHATTPK